MFQQICFFFNIKLFGHLLDNTPEKVLSVSGYKIRNIIDKLIRLVGPKMLYSEQIFVNPDELMGLEKENDEEVLQGRSVIWVANHHFRDDALGSLLATKRHAYFLFGGLPQFYNTIDGFFAFLNGSIVVNRKVKKSRKASVEKMIYALKKGIDILYYPEGGWNKSPNKLILDLWPGIYKVAYETNSVIIPIVHYIFDPTEKMDPSKNKIYTVVGKPFNICQYNEEEGLIKLRDTLATYYYLLCEKYGKTTREEFINSYIEKTGGNRNIDLIGEAYMSDLIETVDKYDSSIETRCDYRKNASPEDVFNTIANINMDNSNYSMTTYAQKVVCSRQKSDFQRRY